MIDKKNIKDDIVAIIDSCGGFVSKERLVSEIKKRTPYSPNYYEIIDSRINNGQVKNDIGLYQDNSGNFKYNKRTAKRNGYL